MADLKKTDPRDAALEATSALYGVISMFTMCNEPVERRGLEEVLRLIHAKLEPATQELNDHWVPLT